MAGWNIIQRMVDDGYRPLIRDDLWAEVRAAIAERGSAIEAVSYGLEEPPLPVIGPVVVGDPIGKVVDYRVEFHRACDGWDYRYDPWSWAKEAEVLLPDWPWLPWYYWNPVSYPASHGGVQVFIEAGLGKNWWTHAPLLDESGPWIPSLKPPLPFADLWTDFLLVLNELVLLRDGTYSDWLDGSWGTITWGMDWSRIWNAKHLDETAMNPLRIVFGQFWSIEETIPAVDVKVELSGDGGTTWENLGTYSTGAGPGSGEFKIVATDGSRWTATSRYRATALGVNADKVWLEDPAYWLPRFIEFDWDFKP